MKAGLALLADRPTHNAVRRLAWQLHRDYGTGLRASRLPPHISLKQPFTIDDLAGLERYFDHFAAQLAPFAVLLPRIQIIAQPSSPELSGIAWFEVTETPLLRQLHNRLNQDLAVRFGGTSAPFDGDSYHFHLTIAVSSRPTDAYHRMAARLDEFNLALGYTACELALFVFDETDPGTTNSLTYKIAPLGESSTAEQAASSDPL